MKNQKLLVIPVPVALHTKLKWRAKKDDKSMARIIRALVTGYLAGEYDIVAHLKADPTPQQGRPIKRPPQDREDFYEDLFKRIKGATDG
jgi:hypothetical protein